VSDSTTPVILSAVRTPIGRYLGGLSGFSAPQLGAMVIREAVARSGVDAGVIEKRRYSERPPRDAYHLTQAGRDLAPVLAALTQWSRQHLPTDERRPNVPHHDHEIDPVVEVRCRTCGERVA